MSVPLPRLAWALPPRLAHALVMSRARSPPPFLAIVTEYWSGGSVIGCTCYRPPLCPAVRA